MTIRKQPGFTLLEMSIVLIIISVVMAGGAVIFAASLQKRQYDETTGKLQFLQQRLLEFRRSYNRIPCPARLQTYAIDNASGYFGVEAATPGTCTGGTPAADYKVGSNAYGMIPTKTLKLPDDYALDGWGHRIAYIVDVNFTATNAFTTIPVNDVDGSGNPVSRITVNGSASSTLTSRAAYVLLSYGPNAHGAYSRGTGTTAPVVINAASTNPYELVNCSCTSGAVYSAPVSFSFYQMLFSQDPTDIHKSFDDIVLYATRYDLRNSIE